MKIAVFGASGLIGKHLIPFLLKNNYEVIAIDKKINQNKQNHYSRLGIDYFEVDITKKDNFKNLPSQGIDAVIHLAGIMPATMEGYEPDRYFTINTIGTLNIVDYCKKASIKQIVYSTSHSDLAGYWGDSIIDPYAPPKYCYGNDHSIYSISKRAAVEILKNALYDFGLEYNIFRCPNIYAWDSPNEYFVDGLKKKVGWKQLINKAITGEPIEIWGNAETKRDLVYIKDLLQMIELSLKCPKKNNIFNVSTGISNSLKEQIITIAKVFNPENRKSEIIFRPEKKVAITNHHYDISNAIQILGYKPKYFLFEMFEDIKKEMLASHQTN